jgi:hypothetical protein
MLLETPERFFNLMYHNSQKSYCCLLSLDKVSLLNALHKFPRLLKNVSIKVSCV